MEDARKERAERLRFKTTVAQGAPKFSGAGVFEFWLKGLVKYFSAAGVEDEDFYEFALLCLEGHARDFAFGSAEDDGTFDGLMNLLRSRFGISAQNAIDAFLELKQLPGQSVRKYGDLIQSRQYGTTLPQVAIVRHFVKTVSDQRIRSALVAQRGLSL